MATIPVYEAPDRVLTASDKGASAFEQAGRRVGPAYNEAATLTRQAGEAQADVIKMRKWPFDMLELEKSIEQIRDGSAGKGNAESGGGPGIRLQGGVNNMVNFNDGDLTDNTGGRSHRGGHRSTYGNDIGGTSVAAAGLSKLAAALAKGNQYRNSEIDPRTGLDMLDPRNQPKGPQYDTVLDHGVVRYKDRTTGQMLGKDTDPYGTGPNAADARAADAFSKTNWSDPANQQLADAFKKQYGYDPATGNFGNAGARPTGLGVSSSNPTHDITVGGPDPYNYDTGSAGGGGGGDYGGGHDPSDDYRPIQQVRNDAGGGAGPGTQDILRDRDAPDIPQGMTPSGAQDAAEVLDGMRNTFGPQQDTSGGNYEDTGGEVI